MQPCKNEQESNPGWWSRNWHDSYHQSIMTIHVNLCCIASSQILQNHPFCMRLHHFYSLSAFWIYFTRSVMHCPLFIPLLPFLADISYTFIHVRFIHVRCYTCPGFLSCTKHLHVAWFSIICELYMNYMYRANVSLA